MGVTRIGAQPGRVPSAELIPLKWNESRQRKVNNTGALYSRKACTEQVLSREGKGREGKGPRFEWARHCRLLLDGCEASVGALAMGLCM